MAIPGTDWVYTSLCFSPMSWDIHPQISMAKHMVLAYPFYISHFRILKISPWSKIQSGHVSHKSSKRSPVRLRPFFCGSMQWVAALTMPSPTEARSPKNWSRKIMKNSRGTADITTGVLGMNLVSKSWAQWGPLATGVSGFIAHLEWTTTGWWFGKCFMFPYTGNNHLNWLINMFQRGSNHQPDQL